MPGSGGHSRSGLRHVRTGCARSPGGPSIASPTGRTDEYRDACDITRHKFRERRVSATPTASRRGRGRRGRGRCGRGRSGRCPLDRGARGRRDPRPRADRTGRAGRARPRRYRDRRPAAGGVRGRPPVHRVRGLQLVRAVAGRAATGGDLRRRCSSWSASRCTRRAVGSRCRGAASTWPPRRCRSAILGNILLTTLLALEPAVLVLRRGPADRVGRAPCCPRVWATAIAAVEVGGWAVVAAVVLPRSELVLQHVRHAQQRGGRVHRPRRPAPRARADLRAARGRRAARARAPARAGPRPTRRAAGSIARSRSAPPRCATSSRSASGSRSSSATPRSSRRSAGSPAASRTTSTTCSP